MFNKLKKIKKSRLVFIGALIVLVIVALGFFFIYKQGSNDDKNNSESYVSRDDFFRDKASESIEQKRAYVSHLLSFNKDEEPAKFAEAEKALESLVQETKSSVDALAYLRFCEQYKTDKIPDCFAIVVNNFGDIDNQDFFTVYPIARIYDFYDGDVEMTIRFYEVSLIEYPDKLSTEDNIMSADEINNRIKELKKS